MTVKQKIKRFESYLDKIEVSDLTKKVYLHIARNIIIKKNKLIIQSRCKQLQTKSVIKHLIQSGIIEKIDWETAKDKFGITEYIVNKKNGKSDRIKRKVLTKEEFDVILNSLPKTENGKQLRLACILSYNCGARLSEILSLTNENIQKNIDEDGNVEIAIQLDETKYDKPRTTWLWLDRLSEEDIEIISNFQKFTITDGYIQVTINRIAKKLNLKNKKISFHSFRHSFATDLIENDVPITTVQRLLGHSNITTTNLYNHPKDIVDNSMKRAGFTKKS